VYVHFLVLTLLNALSMVVLVKGHVTYNIIKQHMGHNMLSELIKESQISNSVKRALAIAITTSLPLFSVSAHATDFQLDNGLKVEWDSSVSYGMMYRLGDQSTKLLADPNAVAGNNNFDKGVVSNRFSFSTEADISGENSGVFIRATGFYDKEVKDLNLPDDVDELHGSDIKILDFFYYNTQDWGSIRIGNQVVSWGESFFLPGLSALQSPIDITKFNVPGVELKEIFLPEQQIYGSLYLSDELSVEAYYQWAWHEHDFDGVGSYFSGFNFFGAGTQDIIIGPGPSDVIPYASSKDNDAKDSGQYGIALRYLATELNDTEFGFYFMNYHDRVSIQAFDADGFHYEYPENNKAYGVSFSTNIDGTNWSGEVFYRPDAPVYSEDFAVARAKIWQANISWIHNFGPTVFADDMDFVGEAVYQDAAPKDGVTLGWGSENASVIAGEFDLYYKNILPSLDIIVPIGFVASLNGTAADQMANFDDKTYSFYTGINGSYLDNWSFSAKYTNFFGEGNDELTGPTKQGPTPSLGDRDFISINVSYSF